MPESSLPVSLPVNHNDYEWRLGFLANQTCIAKYSVTADWELLTDEDTYLTNAREVKNVRGDVNFDLRKGVDDFDDKLKSQHLEGQKCLRNLCTWAIGQSKATVKEVFHATDFVAWRGTMNRIAWTLINPWRKDPKSSWSMIAQLYGDVILISEDKHYHDEAAKLDTFSGFKFENYMTTDMEGNSNTDAIVDNRCTFEMFVKSELTVEGDTLKLFCGAEVDALREDEPIELKTAPEHMLHDCKRNIKIVLQSELVGIETIIFGLKYEEKLEQNRYIVHEVAETYIDKIKKIEDDREVSVGLHAARCYSFLHAVLTRVKKLLKPGDTEACEISYDPLRGEINIKAISKEEANAGNTGVTDDFLAHFNLRRIIFIINI